MTLAELEAQRQALMQQLARERERVAILRVALTDACYCYFCDSSVRCSDYCPNGERGIFDSARATLKECEAFNGVD